MFIYIIGTILGHKKIGYGKSPRSRLKQLQTGNPERLEILHTVEVSDKQARLVEKSSHVILAEYRLTGEWFDVDLETAITAIDRAVNPDKWKSLSEDQAVIRRDEIDREMMELDDEMNALRAEIQSMRAILQNKSTALLDGVARRDALQREKEALFISSIPKKP